MFCSLLYLLCPEECLALEALTTYLLNKQILGRSHWQPVMRVDRAGPGYRQGDQLGTHCKSFSENLGLRAA